jgi:hypothetical protein
VIAPKRQVIPGQSVVNATARLAGFWNPAEFAVTTSRSTDRSDLEFATTDEDVGSGEEGRSVDGICNCKNTAEDRCQLRLTIVTDCREMT